VKKGKGRRWVEGQGRKSEKVDRRSRKEKWRRWIEGEERKSECVDRR